MVQQYEYGKVHSKNAEVQYQKAIFGVKLVLSYIRTCYQIHSEQKPIDMRRLTEVNKQVSLPSRWSRHWFSSCTCCETSRLSMRGLFTYSILSSLSVASSLYGWWAKKPQITRILTITGRTLPIVLAIVSIGVLQAPVVQLDFFRYLIVANLQCMCLRQ